MSAVHETCARVPIKTGWRRAEAVPVGQCGRTTLMARADLLRRLFQSFQQRDDAGFRAAAAEIVDEERRKQHPVVANELDRILRGDRSNGSAQYPSSGVLTSLDAVPTDVDRRSPLLE